MSAPAKRLSLSEIVGAQLAILNRNGSEHSSVKLIQGARGQTQIEVVVRTGDEATLLTVDQAAAKAAEIYNELRAQFPMVAE